MREWGLGCLLPLPRFFFSRRAGINLTVQYNTQAGATPLPTSNHPLLTRLLPAYHFGAGNYTEKELLPPTSDLDPLPARLQCQVNQFEGRFYCHCLLPISY